MGFVGETHQVERNEDVGIQAGAPKENPMEICINFFHPKNGPEKQPENEKQPWQNPFFFYFFQGKWENIGFLAVFCAVN